MNCTVDSEHTVIIGFAALAHRTTSSEYGVRTKTTIIGSIQLYVGVTESQEERHFQVVMSNAALVADQTIHTSSVCMATSHVQGRLRNTPDPLCFHTT